MAKKLAVFFASLAFLVIVANLLLNVLFLPDGVADPVYLLKTSVFGAAVFGLIGFYLGRICDEGKEVAESDEAPVKAKDKELILDNILMYDIGVNLKPKAKKEDAEAKDLS